MTKLHAVLRPYFLRRLKDDVEKSLPAREETVIEIELTTVQKQFYKAVYERNADYLQTASTQNISLQNVAMQLRHCCNQ